MDRVGVVDLSDLERSLRSVALFADVSDAALEGVERCCTYRDYRGGQEIVGHLDDGNDLYFILSGEATVKIYSPQGREVEFRTIGPGQMFGEFAAIDNAPRSASIEAMRDCSIAILPADDFRDFLKREPAVSFALLVELVGKLRGLTQRVVEYSTLAVNNRIQAELLRLADDEGERDGPDDGVVRIPSAPTHAELAARVSTHREAVSRHMSELAKMGIVERKGRTLLIKNRDALAEMLRAATDG